MTLGFALACAPLLAADTKTKTAERLDDSASLFSEIMGTPDRSIPQDLLEKSYCIVLVPDLKKAAFGVGGKYGRGFAVCRAAGGTGWGPPAAIRIEGGSIGFQIGVSSSDVVMLVMNERGMQKLSSSKFTIGADANAAAGPVGRNAIRPNRRVHASPRFSPGRAPRACSPASPWMAPRCATIWTKTRLLYGQRWTSKQILGSGAKIPESASKLIAVLNKYSMREKK